MVSTSRCGRDNPGSNPGYRIIFFKLFLEAYHFYASTVNHKSLKSLKKKKLIAYYKFRRKKSPTIVIDLISSEFFIGNLSYTKWSLLKVSNNASNLLGTRSHDSFRPIEKIVFPVHDISTSNLQLLIEFWSFWYMTGCHIVTNINKLKKTLFNTVEGFIFL